LADFLFSVFLSLSSFSSFLFPRSEGGEEETLSRDAVTSDREKHARPDYKLCE